jgi:hypothetical protein
MPIQVAQASAILDLNHALEEVVASVQQHAVATVQATLLTGSWGSTVITVQRSNDAVGYEDLEDPITIDAAGLTARIDVSGFGYLRARVTTAAGSAATAQVTIVGKGG